MTPSFTIHVISRWLTFVVLFGRDAYSLEAWIGPSPKKRGTTTMSWIVTEY